LVLNDPERLACLSDLPSAGDTAYSGVVMNDRNLFISCHTGPVDRDHPRIMGMVLARDTRIAKVPREKLREANRKIQPPG
jgi:hypothetical protein